MMMMMSVVILVESSCRMCRKRISRALGIRWLRDVAKEMVKGKEDMRFLSSVLSSTPQEDAGCDDLSA